MASFSVFEEQPVTRPIKPSTINLSNLPATRLSRRRRLTAIASISGGSDAEPARPTGFLRPLGEIERTVRRKLADGSLFVLPQEGCVASSASQRRCVVCDDAVVSGTESRVIDERRGLVVAHFVCHTLWARQSQAIRELHDSPGGRS